MIGKQRIRYVYIDIVGFTRPGRTIEFQNLVFRNLNEVILRSVKEIPYDKRILLQTGDGVCFGLLPWEGMAVDADLKLAADILNRIMELNAAAADERARFGVRIGMNEGEDDIVIDVNGHLNFAGSGVNMAKRIMDLADENQILVGVNTYQRLKGIADYQFKFYECRIKHDETLVLYQCTRLNHENETLWLNASDIAYYRMTKKPGYEKEYKFLVLPDQARGGRIFSEIRSGIKRWGADLALSDQIEKLQYTDAYLDDASLTLYAANASFRIRKEARKIHVTARKRVFRPDPHTKEEVLRGIREACVITAMEAKELKQGKPVNILPYHILPYIAPDHEALSPVVGICNQRQKLTLTDLQGNAADLCLDALSFSVDERRMAPHFELKIKNRNLPHKTIEALADRLGKNLGLIPSVRTRYARGISMLKAGKIRRPRQKVIIDTDCGVDDALALILALKSPELEVMAVTAVSGQVHVDKVVPNIFKVYEAMNLTSPPLVAKGAGDPLKKKLVTSEFIHGNDGLGDVIAPPRDMPLDPMPAWQRICTLARSHPKQITCITIGPMTNLALAVQNDPDGVACLKEIVAMGGVFFESGNVGPGTEFNVNTDPEAADEVLRFCRQSCLKTPVNKRGRPVHLPLKPAREDYRRIAGYRDHDPTDPVRVPLTFIGLDVTQKLLFRKSTLLRAVDAQPENGILRFVRDISKKYMAYCHENEWLAGCHIFDPLAVGYVINPFFLTLEEHVVHVETAGSATRGMVFADTRPTRNPEWRNPAEEVIRVARSVDKEAFEFFFLMRLMNRGKEKNRQ